MSNRSKTFLIVLVLILIIIPILWAGYLRIAKGYGWADWTGFGEYTLKLSPDGVEIQRGKTLWDVLELLIVPLALAGVALLFNWSERRADRETAEQRAETDRELALDRQRETNLQSYLDKMADLLLKRDLLRRSGDPGEPVRNVAQTRTTTILRTLDKDRRDIVFQFLRDAGLAEDLLVGADLEKIDLEYSDIAGINLSGANLSWANLSQSHLSGAELIRADLRGSYLIGAELDETDLSGAELSGANLSEAILSRANLGEANLSGVILSRANLRRAYLNGIILIGAELIGADLIGAELSGAYLSVADLSKANLSDAKLLGANLRETDLSEADLNGANLNRANLKNAKITTEQLSKAKSLTDAIMPDGTKFTEPEAKTESE